MPQTSKPSSAHGKKPARKEGTPAPGWEPEWEEQEMPGRRRRRWLPSTRLLVLALGFWVGALLIMALGLLGGNGGSNQTALVVFLVCLVVSAISAAFASFFAAFGFFRYRRRKVWNLLLFLVSVVTNPVVLIMLAAGGIA